MHSMVGSLRKDSVDLREEMPLKVQRRDREINTILMKLKELTKLITGKETEAKYVPSQRAPIDSGDIPESAKGK